MYCTPDGTRKRNFEIVKSADVALSLCMFALSRFICPLPFVVIKNSVNRLLELADGLNAYKRMIVPCIAE